MKDNNYEFRVGDEVETIDGMVGKIVSICHCEKCAERGFFEPRWETPDGKYSDYITVYQKNCCFPDYRRIGKYVWNHETDEEKINENILQKENRKMKEIKLTIDGKEVSLTDEQLRLLEIKGRWSNPFSRVKKDKVFYSVSGNGEVLSFLEDGNYADDELEKCANYFNNKKFATQIALHQLLNRKLLKYAYDNEYEDKEWNGTNIHFYIIYNSTKKDYDTRWTRNEKEPGTVYFKSGIWATAALNEVVKPFVREHPEFEW